MRTYVLTYEICLSLPQNNMRGRGTEGALVKCGEDERLIVGCEQFNGIK